MDGVAPASGIDTVGQVMSGISQDELQKDGESEDRKQKSNEETSATTGMPKDFSLFEKRACNW